MQGGSEQVCFDCWALQSCSLESIVAADSAGRGFQEEEGKTQPCSAMEGTGSLAEVEKRRMEVSCAVAPRSRASRATRVQLLHSCYYWAAAPLLRRGSSLSLSALCSLTHYCGAQSGVSALDQAQASGHIVKGQIGVDSQLIIDKTQEKAQAEHTNLLAHFDEQKRKRELALPTTDKGVKQKLRAMGEPICMFGEEARDRRERLRDLMVQMEQSGQDLPEPGEGATAMDEVEEANTEEDEKNQLFYTEGSEELKAARQWIAKYSLPRGGERVRQQKRRREEISKKRGEDPLWDDPEVEGALSKVSGLENRSSQVGDDRPISTCAFCSDGSMLATGSWSSMVKLWSSPECAMREGGRLRGHTERVNAVAFHPEAARSLAPGAANLASASADRNVNLWSLESDTPLATLEGHFDSVAGVTYHPSGRFLISTSHDKTCRMWDLETQKCVLVQEGHSRGVYAASCQVDGSLLATCGLDCIARVWDQRSGKCVLVLEGHVKQVLGVDFHPQGFQLATGSADHTVRIWDLRKKNCAYIIPAHSALISAVKYQPVHGNYLVTSSYDTTCKLWNASTYSHIKTLGA